MMLVELIRSWGMMGVVAASLLAGSASVGTDGDCTPCYYKKVVCYENQKVPYTVCVTRYDHCGRPYQVEVVRYRTVTVRVVKLVKVCS